MRLFERFKNLWRRYRGPRLEHNDDVIYVLPVTNTVDRIYHWTFKIAQDARPQMGIDVEAEIATALAQEIAVETERKILQTIFRYDNLDNPYGFADIQG